MQIAYLDYRSSKPTEARGMTPTDWQAFHDLQSRIYANDPHFVAPLRQDIEDIFSEKNAAFRAGPARIWMVRDEKQTVLGRIAAFVDRPRNEQLDLPAGGLGFFDCVDDPAVADLLFSAAEDWLREQGMQVVDGPINFGERDKFWGLLTRGWYPPVYQETYNPPRYRGYFEDRGFVAHEQCLTMRGRVADFPGDRLRKVAARVRERYGLWTKQITRATLRQDAEDFATAYNAAFHHNPYFKPLGGDDIYPAFRAMKPILDPHLTCLAYNKDNEPIGLAGLIPDLNCFLGGLNGKLNWLGLPQFLYRLKFQKRRNCKGIAFGISQEYQRQGVYPLMVDAMFQSGNKHNARTYAYVDMATIRGHNNLMVSTCRQMNTEIHRVHLAYRKALVEGVEWQPFSMLDVSSVSMGDLIP